MSSNADEDCMSGCGCGQAISQDVDERSTGSASTDERSAKQETCTGNTPSDFDWPCCCGAEEESNEQANQVRAEPEEEP